MPHYYYDAATNCVLWDDSDDALTSDGMLKDGHSLRVKMTAMDAAQVAIAQSEADEIDDETDDDDIDDGGEFIDQQALYDIERAELAAAYKGGLQVNDRLMIAGKAYIIDGRNPDNGKFQLVDASTLDGNEAKQAAYDAYAQEIQTAWMRDKILPSNTARVGGQCMLNGVRGTYRMKGGELVCVTGASKDPSDREWEMAGPLSDQQLRDARQIKDEAYEEHRIWLENAWK